MQNAKFPPFKRIYTLDNINKAQQCELSLNWQKEETILFVYRVSREVLQHWGLLAQNADKKQVEHILFLFDFVLWYYTLNLLEKYW